MCVRLCVLLCVCVSLSLSLTLCPGRQRFQRQHPDGRLSPRYQGRDRSPGGAPSPLRRASSVLLQAGGAALPVAVRAMLGSLRLLVKQRFGEEVARKAVGAVLFLRFICPALAAPDAFGLLASALPPVCARACRADA